MHAKIGGRVLICLLYGQALFGLLAVAAVMLKEPHMPQASAPADLNAVAAMHASRAAL